ncbi:hypothetical protein Moror_2018 [Moniliophthora roreri MCA 2997]|uniref:Uncharacterized protein n=2 Tax=Moniliophthora roreri TaxID=221103 RepID=V2WKZ3_MONRO|nr:hypothetical protein Moror_2018 [Moniliophthora roreri MCA 2997]KAI3610435.1 hypothetical protein WG66_007239 [Moniliophthora roreri]
MAEPSTNIKASYNEAVVRNDKVFAAMHQDIDTDSNYATSVSKLTTFAKDQRAYYDGGRQKILELVKHAHDRLQQTLGFVSISGFPFNVNDFPAHPFVEPYKDAVKTISKFQKKYAKEPELQKEIIYLLSTIYSPDRQVIDVDADELPSNPGATNATPSGRLPLASTALHPPPRSPSVTSSVTRRDSQTVVPTPVDQNATPIIPPSISVAAVQQASMSPAANATEPTSTFPNAPSHVTATPSHSPRISPTASHFDLSQVPHPHSSQLTISKAPKKKKKINVFGVLETVQGKIGSSMTPPVTAATIAMKVSGSTPPEPDTEPMLSTTRQVSGEPSKPGATEAISSSIEDSIKQPATEHVPPQPNPVPLAPISEIYPKPIAVVASKEQSTSAEPVPERQDTGSSVEEGSHGESTADQLLGLLMVHEHARERNDVSQLSKREAIPKEEDVEMVDIGYKKEEIEQHSVLETRSTLSMDVDKPLPHFVEVTSAQLSQSLPAVGASTVSQSSAKSESPHRHASLPPVATLQTSRENIPIFDMASRIRPVMDPAPFYRTETEKYRRKFSRISAPLVEVKPSSSNTEKPQQSASEKSKSVPVVPAIASTSDAMPLSTPQDRQTSTQAEKPRNTPVSYPPQPAQAFDTTPRTTPTQSAETRKPGAEVVKSCHSPAAVQDTTPKSKTMNHSAPNGPFIPTIDGFGPSMTTPTRLRMPPTGNINFKLDLTATQFANVDRWNRRMKDTSDIGNIHKSCCVSLGCFKSADLEHGMALNSEGEKPYHLWNRIKPSWPQQGEMVVSMRVVMNGKSRNVVLTPPIDLTPEHNVDLGPYLKEGHNGITLSFRNRTIEDDYCFVIFSHTPTKAQLEALQRRLEKNQDFASFLEELSRPFTIYSKFAEVE